MPAALPEVVMSAEQPLDCSPEALEQLAQSAAAQQINRVVVAASTPWIGRARAAGGLCQGRLQQVPGGDCQHPE